MTFMCKKCRKAFRKDMSNYEESDEYCPHCDNHYVRALPVFPTFQPRDFGAVQRGSHWPPVPQLYLPGVYSYKLTARPVKSR